MKEMTREWIKKAEEDFGVAGRELKANTGAYNVICYHSHQSEVRYPNGDAYESMAKKVYALAEKIRKIVMKKLDI